MCREKEEEERGKEEGKEKERGKQNYKRSKRTSTKIKTVLPENKNGNRWGSGSGTSRVPNSSYRQYINKL